MNKPYLNVIVEDLADIELNNIYYYNLKFSVKNAIEVDSTIKLYINNLPISPYLGRCNLEMSDERYRERIYRKNRHSGYRIMYYISEKSSTIYVFNVMNCKQDFSLILKRYNNFKKYLDF